MKATGAERRSTRRSSRWRMTMCRSKRSSAVLVTAGNSSVESFGATGTTSFAPGRVRWNSVSSGSMLNGHRDVATALTSGGASKGRGFGAHSGWSPNGRPGDGAQREPTPRTLQRIPSALTIARLMTTGRNNLSKADTITITAIEEGVPRLVEARETIVEFQAMIRNKTDAGLTKWIAAAQGSLVASFASGVAKDELAVRAAITLPWSNGQTEGQITKLKLVKRQMYGRAKIDLLQARLIGAPA